MVREVDQPGDATTEQLVDAVMLEHILLIDELEPLLARQAVYDLVTYIQAGLAGERTCADQQQRPEHELDAAIRQIVSRAVVTDGVVDIFAAAGLKKPDISISSDEFLAEVGMLPQKNLAGTAAQAAEWGDPFPAASQCGEVTESTLRQILVPC